jgi:uncharacterized membrane protein YfcA
MAIELSLFEIVFIACTGLLAGLVKGTIGMGMKIVMLGLLATIVELPVAIAIIIVPGIVSNLWQILEGPPLLQTLRRTWSLFAVFCIGIWVGAEILVVSNPVVLTVTLGALLVVYAAYALLAPQLPDPGRHEIWMSPAFGGVTGIFGGMTGSDVIPGVPYLQTLDMGRDALIQSMGILFLLGSSVIAVAFFSKGLLTSQIGLVSAGITIPTLAGYWLGTRIRRNLPEQTFRRVFLAALLLLGLYIVVTNIS